MIKILVLNGPNLNFLGIREPSVYGNETIDDLNEYIDKYATDKGVECYFFQSNSEGELIDAIQSVYYDFDGCILNAGAYQGRYFFNRKTCNRSPYVRYL